MDLLGKLSAYFATDEKGRAHPIDPLPLVGAAFDRAVFFDVCRTSVMGPTLDGDEVSGAEAILDAMARSPLSWTA